MRKHIWLIILLYILFLSSCKSLIKDPSIGEASVAKSIDRNTLKPIETLDKFTQSDPAIHFTFKVTDLPGGTKLKAVWKYLTDNTEVVSEKLSNGTHYEVFTLKRSGNQFPAGKYEVTVTGDANGKSLETKGTFEITAEVKPTHLLNPVTSKAVEGNDTLNPTNISSLFTREEPSVYFVIQSKDLPSNSKVRCLWYYEETGDTISHEIVTEGSRNIAFTLKPDEGKSLPSGKYKVIASVTINNQTESVTSNFQIQ